MYKLKKVHLQAAYRVLHYLKESPDKGIMLREKYRLLLKTYINANYAGSIVNKRSTTCYYTFLRGSMVILRNEKQNVVARMKA